MAIPLYQLTILIWGIVKFQNFISFCRGANISGKYEFVKNAMLLSIFSFAPLVALSITFMWVSYDKNWAAGVIFVFLPVLSILFFVLSLLGTKNDISNQIDNMRRGRKRLPIQPPPQLIVAPVTGTNDFQMSMTPQKQLSPNFGGKSPVLPIQQR
jgi:glucan phosphoethanolaminetransferase (alkaline phosphatase superfamily)